MVTYQKVININERQIAYTLRKNRRAKRLRLVVYCDATVTVSSPLRVSNSYIENYIRYKAGEWLIKKINLFRKLGGGWTLKGSEQDYENRKAEALQIASRKVREINSVYGFKYNKISIRNQKLRWGSCSRNGNLSFNYKLVYLQNEELDYLITHEICHLKEFNHSDRFWKLVAIRVPNFKEMYKKLKSIRV